MEGQTVSLYFQTEAVVPSKTDRQNEQTSLTAKCFDKIANKNFTVHFQSLGKHLHSIPNHFTLPLVPIDHQAVNSL